MTTKEENLLLTRTGPGTPGGELMRRYWHPIALSDELPLDSAPLPITILSEELVLFRDDKGRAGLVGMYCPHRCADLSYGRVEDGGLRCLYHGWLFDVAGKCLDQPAEPAESRFKEKIQHIAYPIIEKAGLIFAYLGKGEAPLMPNYEFLTATPERRYVQKTAMECNYLQSVEGDIDPAHLSYLHKPFARKDPRNVPGSTKSADVFYREDGRPKLEPELTDFGVRNYSVRTAEDGRRYVRVTNFLMPNKSTIVGNEGRIGEGYSVHWHVPIDDENHYRIDFVFNRIRPVSSDRYVRERATEMEGLRYKRNKSNRYGQDRALMKTSNYTGMGDYFAVHDAFATETPGAIHDRSRENLGTTDVCIVQARRQLLKGIADVQAGNDPIHVIRETSKNDMSHIVVVSEVVPPEVDYHDVWKERRQKPQAAE
jgi:phenylpropionate dioxygenase-like ring-hydroxylating dioxygenase large terminal subunit